MTNCPCEPEMYHFSNNNIQAVFQGSLHIVKTCISSCSLEKSSRSSLPAAFADVELQIRRMLRKFTFPILSTFLLFGVFYSLAGLGKCVSIQQESE